MEHRREACTIRFVHLACSLAILIACHPTSPPVSATPPPPASPQRDLVITTSAHDHATTLARLVTAVESRGLTVVARIDHAAGATAAGLSLPPTTVLIFGNPKAGTPLMVSAPSIALDLPLRVLVAQNGARVEVTYRAPAALAAAHGIGDHPIAAKLTEALGAITTEATR